MNKTTNPTTSKQTAQPEPTKTKLVIAGYEVCPIPTGLFALDGGAMFGTVPKVLWQRSNPSDDLNRIPMEARALLLKGHGKNILIDTGNGSDFVAKYGEKLGHKFSEMYAIDENGPSLIKSLKKFNVNPEDVTDVILTHLHFDHAGGATTEKNNQLVPTFPKATYYVQEANLKTASEPNAREKASYFKANFEPLIACQQLKLTHGSEKNILPNISFFVSNGHTEGHQAVIIEDAQSALVFCGDVIPTSSHVRNPWVMGYDLNPLVIMAEKKQLLELSDNKKTYYYFEHDPYCDAAVVEKQNNDYIVKERLLL